MLHFLIAVMLGSAVAGGIEGRITIRQLPTRMANRYAGAGGASAHPVKQLPAIVFIEGAVPGQAPPARRDAELAQQDTAFQPALLAIPVGATVRFLNQDRFFHNVFSYSKTKRFDLGRYPKGESKSVTFDEAGAVAVFCEIHKWMRAAIVVLQNPFYAIADEDGSFRISNVPAGSYKVTVWHSERGRKTFNVSVPARGNATVNATF